MEGYCFQALVVRIDRHYLYELQWIKTAFLYWGMEGNYLL